MAKRKLGLLLVLILIILVILILFLSPNIRSTVTKRISACHVYTRQLWLVDLGKKTMTYKGSEDQPIELCGTLYHSGKENMIVQLIDSRKKVVYQEPVNVALYDWYHTENDKGETEGGMQPAETTILDFYFPDEIDYKTIKLVNAASNQLVSQIERNN
jgi:protein-tyrosine phosphatase